MSISIKASLQQRGKRRLGLWWMAGAACVFAVAALSLFSGDTPRVSAYVTPVYQPAMWGNSLIEVTKTRWESSQTGAKGLCWGIKVVDWEAWVDLRTNEPAVSIARTK
jgi:hypothetical protein